MSSLETRKIEPQTGTTVTLGAGGDTVLVSADQVKTNTVKDAGGNTIFTSDGAGTLSSVNSALSGSMIFISSQTAPAGTSEVVFTSGLDSTYDEYMFVYVNIDILDSENSYKFSFNTSTDGGSSYNTTKTTTVFRSIHAENGSTYFNYDTGYDHAQSTDYQALGPNQEDDDGDASTSGILHLFTPSNTSYVKHFYSRSHTMNDEAGGSAASWFVAGYLNTTSAINAISFKNTVTGTFSGTIAMYGVR